MPRAAAASPLDEVDAAVAAHYARLSPSQRRAIDHLLADTRYGAIISPAELARAVQVHPSVLTRAAQTLGFEGFPDLQARLRAGLMRVVPTPPIENTPAAEAIRVMREDVECLQSTVETLTPEALDAVVAALLAARRVYLFGARGAHGLALIAGMAMRLLLPDVRVVRQDFGDLAEQIVGLDGNDALVAIGFLENDRVTDELLRWAGERGATTIGITHHRSNPVARATRHTLFVRVGSPHQIPSYPAAGASLINALATAIAVRTRGSVEDRIGETQQLWSRLDGEGTL